MGRTRPLLLLLALSGCSDAPDTFRGARSGGAEEPAIAARDFLRLVKRGRCDRAFERFSEETRRQITLRSRAEIRNAPYYREAFSPENLFCRATKVNRFASYQPESATRAGMRGDTAVVTVMLREAAGFLVPGFWSTSHTDTPVQMLLVREAGQWRVAIPGVYAPPPGGEPLEIGRFSVRVRPQRDPTDGRVSMEVTGPGSVAPSWMRDAFLDFERWPELFPGIVEARALEPPRPGLYQHVYIRVRAPSGEEADFVVDLEHASGRMATEPYVPPRGTAHDSAVAAARREAYRDPPFFRVGWHIPERDTVPRVPGVARIGTFGATLSLERGRQPPSFSYSFTVDTAEWPLALRSAFEPRNAVLTVEALLAGTRRHAGR